MGSRHEHATGRHGDRSRPGDRRQRDGGGTPLWLGTKFARTDVVATCARHDNAQQVGCRIADGSPSNQVPGQSPWNLYLLHPSTAPGACIYRMSNHA